MMKQVNEIIEQWVNHLLETDRDIKNALEKIKRESEEKFIELVMTGKTTYHVPYEEKSRIQTGE